MEYTSRRKRKINKSMKTIRIKKKKRGTLVSLMERKKGKHNSLDKRWAERNKNFLGFQEKKLLVSDKEAVVSSQVIRHRSSSLSWHFHQPLNYQHITIVPRKKQQQKLEDIFFFFFFSKKICFPPIEVKKRTLSSQIYQALIYQLPASLLLDYSSIIHFFSLPSTIDRLEETNFFKKNYLNESSISDSFYS